MFITYFFSMIVAPIFFTLMAPFVPLMLAYEKIEEWLF